ncbi:MAG: ABC transporter [Gemmatimonadetes bacterium]|nr:MAG: ABC transporter [Gemmatimonadota bacterium]
MNNNKPPYLARIYSVWYRHMLVYTRDLVSNGLPPFLEPLIFLAGIGLGLGKYIDEMAGMPYIQFLATGLLVTSAMYTAAFECTYSTFIRLEFDKVYDGMLAAPITATDLLVGEILWAGSKGFFFSFCVLVIIYSFGIIPISLSLLTPLIGLITGLMFAAISLFVTSYVKNINHFNFFMTGFLSPMFFFSGVVFPIQDLPGILQPVAEIFPLTHSVRLVRMVCIPYFEPSLLLDAVYCVLITLIFGYLAIYRLRRRLIQ